MPAKEWLVPLVLAAVTFAGLAQVDLDRPAPRTGDEAHDGAEARSGFRYAFPQRHVVAAADRNATVILLADDPMPTGRSGNTDWRSPHVAMQDSLPVLVLCTSQVPCGQTHVVADPAQPRLGAAGFNATRVTVHVFDAQGELVFSNGDEAEQARLVRRHQPEQLPDGVWYLGANETAPDGTRRLPAAAAAFLDGVRPLLDGLPEGGVASVETEALRTWYGTLYVTLRVDELVHAP